MKTAVRAPWYAALMHPACWLAAGVLVLNDHYLKVHHPSFWTGKLSDVAFMILAPLWLYAGWLGLKTLFNRNPPRATRKRALLAALGVIALTFTLMQTTPLGDALFRWGLGALQYPFRVLWGLAVEGELVKFAPVHATMDLTDLVCLPVLYLTWRWGLSTLPTEGSAHD